jgi:23S rRNA pseudouridine1911/1915/1917 synthase
MTEIFRFQVTKKSYKMRLDEFLFAEFPYLSRMYLRELVRDEKCEVNGRWENRGYLLRTNDFVEIEVDRRRQTSLQPEPIPLEILFEDGELLVVNKPAGMLVHPTVKVRTGTLLNALAHHLNSEKRKAKSEKTESEIEIDDAGVFVRAGLVHRLDKQTSGLLVIAKRRRAHRILCGHFQRKLVEKKYFAVVEGAPEKDSGTIEAPIGRYAETRFWDVKADGKKSVTRFWARRRFDDKTLLELEPVTGRTNQLRIHLAHIGHAIIGDEKYGGREFSRLCLHAYKIAFRHPTSGDLMTFETALPKEFFD